MKNCMNFHENFAHLTNKHSYSPIAKIPFNFFSHIFADFLIFQNMVTDEFYEKFCPQYMVKFGQDFLGGSNNSNISKIGFTKNRL